jgi:hypothetical protein
MNTQHIITATTQAVIAGVLATALIAASFFIVEPRVGQAVTSGPFTVRTTVTDEISFLVNAANVTATTAINGITGGTANGSTTVVVRTNSASGYYMTIAYYDNGTDNAMIGDNSLSDSIHDYASSSTEPTFGFYTASTSSVFGYTVSADNDSDLDQSFLHDGSGNCNAGATYNGLNCWMEPTVAAFQVVDRGTSASGGATTTLHFRVHVPNSPNPALVADTYTATATLTALNQ